jgi:hypothetical protein
MPRYKVLADSFIDGRLVPASAGDAPVIVAYDGEPGSNLAPLDDDGRALPAGRAAVPDVPAPPPPAGAATHHVPIPAWWLRMNTPRLLSLAARLGAAPDVTTRTGAQAVIRAELQRRASS